MGGTGTRHFAKLNLSKVARVVISGTAITDEPSAQSKRIEIRLLIAHR